MERLELSLKDAAKELGVSPGAIRCWTNNGTLECFWTPGGQRRFSHAQLQRFVERSRLQKTPRVKATA